MDYDEIEVGDILLMHCGICKPPKNKYFIVAVIEPEPVLLFVNSELNNYVRNNSHLYPCHISIKNTEEDFLSHDSWVNCCEAFHDFNIDDIERDLKYGGKHCGSLTQMGISHIIDGITKSPVMKRKTKTRIIASLSSAL